MNLFQKIHNFIKAETAVRTDTGDIDTAKIAQGVIDIHTEHHAAEVAADKEPDES